MKKIYIIHRWSGSPTDSWIPWIKNELEREGCQVVVPAMPDPDEPSIEKWVTHLAELIPFPAHNFHFIGHSVGAQTILRYLERLPNDAHVGGAAFVAGWLNDLKLDNEEEKRIAQPWLETPIDFEKVRERAHKFVALFSDNDPYVPLSQKDVFEKELKAHTILEPGKGHFTDEDGILELPSLLHEIKKI